LLQKAEVGGNDSYTARLRTKGGFASFNNEADELIFELLPIVNSLDPDRARRLAERRPALRQRELASGPIEQVESSFVRNLDEGDSNKLHELGLQRSRLANIQTVASEKPEEALNLANTLTDTALKSAALAAVAAGFATRQPERAVKVEKLAEDLIPSIDNLAGKLRAWVAVGQAAASINDMEAFHEALKKAFGVGEEVVQEDLELNLGKPILLAQGYEDLSKLTKISARRDAQQTLGYISRLSNLPLQAYLLIDAADALFELRSGKQGH
jgi:hypothetical protein